MQKKVAGKRKGDFSFTDLSKPGKTDQLIGFYVLGGRKSKAIFVGKSSSL